MLPQNSILRPRFQDNRISWRPIPGSAQERALSAPVNELLLTGGRGWGKTETQLMRFARRVGEGYGSHWRGIIFDREYKNLDDLVVKSKRLFNDLYGKDARFLSSNTDFKWVWSTGEELLFRVAARADDYWSYHGHEYPFVGWNELTKYPTSELYSKLRSVNRTGWVSTEHTSKLTGELPVGQNMSDVENWNLMLDDFGHQVNRHYLGRPFQVGDYMTGDGLPLPEIPLEIVSTTNPYGPGHNWVKSEFIDAAPYGKIVRREQEIYNPRTLKDEIIVRTQVTIFGSFRENPYLSPQYIAGLYAETDENVLKAWLYGNWDIVAGGALDDVWKRHVHVIPRFKVPLNWYVDRSFDWGSTQPYAVGFWAEANGEEVKLSNGATICPPRGTLIKIAELYGTKKIGTNIGLKKSARDIAKDIKAMEKQLRDDGWLEPTHKVYAGPADNGISSVTEITTDTPEKLMASEGVHWEKSDKSHGSRKVGLQLIRERLEASTKGEKPGLLFCVNCVASISTIPILPRSDKDMDDVDTAAEDHLYDETRYRALKGNNRFAKVIKVNFPR